MAVSEAIPDPASAGSPPALLRSLFSGPHRRYQPMGSFALGLLGLVAFAICTSAAAGVYLSWAAELADSGGGLITTIAALLTLLPAAGAYVAVLLTLHLIGSCNLFLTVRLLLVYSVLYVSLSAVMSGMNQPMLSIYVLYAASFSLGSFFQRRLGGWHADSWNQPPGKPTAKITIGDLLDFTASIALTIWLVQLDGQSMPVGVFYCFSPVCALCAVLGMHVWARLTAICDDSSDVASGFGFWMAGNITLACLIWLLLAMLADEAPQHLMGFVASVAIIPVAHLWTEIPILWLRACGWSLARR